MPSPLAFLKVERKVFLDPIELGEPPLRERPERFDAVNVGTVAFGKFVPVVPEADMPVVSHVDQSMISAPGIRVDGAFEGNLPGDDFMQGFSLAVRDNLGVDPTIALVDAEDRLPVSAAPAAGGDAPGMAGAEVALVNFNPPLELPELSRLMGVDRSAKKLVVAIDSIAVDAQKPVRLRSGKIEAKAPDNLFSDIVADWSIFPHLSRLTHTFC